MNRRSFIAALFGLIGLRSVAPAAANPIRPTRLVSSNTSTHIQFMPEFTLSPDVDEGVWRFNAVHIG